MSLAICTDPVVGEPTNRTQRAFRQRQHASSRLFHKSTAVEPVTASFKSCLHSMCVCGLAWIGGHGQLIGEVGSCARSTEDIPVSTRQAVAQHRSETTNHHNHRKRLPGWGQRDLDDGTFGTPCTSIRVRPRAKTQSDSAIQLRQDVVEVLHLEVRAEFNQGRSNAVD